MNDSTNGYDERKYFLHKLAYAASRQAFYDAG